MKKLSFTGILAVVTLFTACQGNRSSQVQQAPLTGNKSFEVAEVIHGNQYSYMRVVEDMDLRWVAVSRQDISKGETYYYDTQLEMNDFHSREIDRTFDAIYFINQISKTPFMSDITAGPQHSGKIQIIRENEISIAKNAEELTIAQIFGEPASYSEKTVEIRGVVVKVNAGIMGKNWIHIQDGTGTDSNYNLTVTTQEMAGLNQEVTFRGVIAVNKDFGSGYFYEVIMEDAVFVNSRQ